MLRRYPQPQGCCRHPTQTRSWLRPPEGNALLVCSRNVLFLVCGCRGHPLLPSLQLALVTLFYLGTKGSFTRTPIYCYFPDTKLKPFTDHFFFLRKIGCAT